ncbi:MAG: nucleoside triphosphate pyrophosphohydrolase [Sandaracinaceae bacterium]
MSELPRGSRVARLVEIMRRLLAPDGCPWDREQTFRSLSAYVLEEAFEVVDAIDSGDPAALEEELGDLLLQVVFLSELASARGWFGPDDVADAISDKLVRRHPHVFGDADASDAAAVAEQWEAIKKKEKAGRGALEGIPVALPALLRASRVAQKASRIGLDWPDAAAVRAKVDEELAELDAAQDAEGEARELGDVLFALASWAHKRGHDPELALRTTLDRFGARVRQLEADAKAAGEDLATLGADEIDRRWRRVKAQER